jgi:hypothetical protein
MPLDESAFIASYYSPAIGVLFLSLGEPDDERQDEVESQDIYNIYILFLILNLSSSTSSSSTCLNTQPPFLAAPDVFFSLTLLAHDTLSVSGLFALPLISTLSTFVSFPSRSGWSSIPERYRPSNDITSSRTK